MPETNVRDVRAPDLVRPPDRQPVEQVRIDLVLRPALAQARLRIDGLQAHAPQQARHTLVIDLVPAGS